MYQSLPESQRDKVSEAQKGENSIGFCWWVYNILRSPLPETALSSPNVIKVRSSSSIKDEKSNATYLRTFGILLISRMQLQLMQG